MRTALFTDGLDRPRSALAEILQRAADRGEVPDTRDVDLLTDIVLGFSMMRMLRGATMDRALARRMIFDVLSPLVMAPRSDSAGVHRADDRQLEAHARGTRREHSARVRTAKAPAARRHRWPVRSG